MPAPAAVKTSNAGDDFPEQTPDGFRRRPSARPPVGRSTRSIADDAAVPGACTNAPAADDDADVRWARGARRKNTRSPAPDLVLRSSRPRRTARPPCAAPRSDAGRTRIARTRCNRNRSRASPPSRYAHAAQSQAVSRIGPAVAKATAMARRRDTRSVAPAAVGKGRVHGRRGPARRRRSPMRPPPATNWRRPRAAARTYGTAPDFHPHWLAARAPATPRPGYRPVAEHFPPVLPLTTDYISVTSAFL